MFAPILNWVMGGFQPRGDAPPALAPSDGREILVGTARRREILAEISDLLVRIPREQRPELVGHTAARFAHFVVDLPASEKSHDKGAFGLLDHSLEVAFSVARKLARPSFRVSEDPVENYREQPIWGYAGVVLGLLHDAGKVFDLEVMLPNAGAAWDPLSEPLMSYLRRFGRTSSGIETWRWKSGRGMNAHVWKTEALAPLILPDQARQFLGNRMAGLIQLFARSYDLGREELGTGPARRVIETVRHADRVHAEAAAPSKDVGLAQRVDDHVVMTGGAATPERILDDEQPGPTAPASETPKTTSTVHGVPAESTAVDEGAPKPSFNPANASLVGSHRKENRGAKVYSLPRHVPDRDRRIEGELQPEKLIESIQNWVLRSGHVSRNATRGEVFVRADYIWLRYPEVFKGLLQDKGINWTSAIGERLLSILLKRPEVDPENPRNALVYAFPEPRDEKPTTFVRLKARAFLPERELADLGYWPHEMRVQPTAVARQRELPFQRIQGRRF